MSNQRASRSREPVAYMVERDDDVTILTFYASEAYGSTGPQAAARKVTPLFASSETEAHGMEPCEWQRGD